MYTDTAHVDPPVLEPSSSLDSAPRPQLVAPRFEHRNLRHDEFWRGLPAFAQTGAEEFETHTFQQRHTVTNVRQLRDTVGTLVPETFFADVEAGLKNAPMALRISPYLLSLVDWSQALTDPIRTQFIPVRSQQRANHPMAKLDSLHEQADSPVPGLTHRYRDKALFLPLDSCPVYCRFCTRSYAIGAGTEMIGEKVRMRASLARWEEAFAYLEKTEEVEDVVISGGDAYNLKPEHLQFIGERLLSIGHIRRIRFATKGLCVMPQKILSDHAWVDALSRTVDFARRLHKDAVVHTHFNNANEITGITERAMQKLVSRGIYVRAQTVLQRTVNDSAERMQLLVSRLSYVNIHPYYVYFHDMVPGVEDLRTSLGAGLDVEKRVRGYTAGFNTPAFVVDTPGGGGKRDAHSYEHYDPVTGIAVFTSPSVKPGRKFLYFDPVASLAEREQWRWSQPAEQQAMIAEALEVAG